MKACPRLDKRAPQHWLEGARDEFAQADKSKVVVPALVAGIHALLPLRKKKERRGWPGQARP
jgi:hypothetical protein